MHERSDRLFILTFVLGLLLSISGFVYAQYVDAQAYELSLQSKDLLLETAELQSAQLKEQVTTTQKELDQKQAELTAKKAELDKASQDLVAKIKELDSANKKIKDQQSQLSANASELSKLRGRPPLFSFKIDASSLQNVEQKKEDIKQLVTDSYDVITDIYSQPYLLHEVTISFVDTFNNPNAAAEISISNGSDGLSITIKIKDFDKNSFTDVNSIIHELIHSFRGLAVLDPVAYEEGSTVAATDAVMTKLIAQGKIPSFNPLYIRYSASDYVSAPTLPSSNSSFYASSDAAKYYQVAGYGWYEIYKADNNFFKTFNEKIYDKKRDGNEITADVVKQAIKESTNATVQGKSISEWLETKAFKLN